MFKFLFTVVLILAAAYFGLTFKGYQFHPENFSYYMPEKAEDGQNMFTQFIEKVKSENDTHPLISRKEGPSPTDSFDKSSTDFLKTAMQADKFDQMEKMKKKIDEIKVEADKRDKIITETEIVKGAPGR